MIDCSTSCTGSMSPLPFAVPAAIGAVSGHPPFSVPTSFVSPVVAARYAAVAFGPKLASTRPDESARSAAAWSS